MEILENNSLFSSTFEMYKKKFDELKELSDDELPKSLRLFDIRFRLSLSLTIGFDNLISYTSTENTRKTYNLIMKLNDLWFSYEGLYNLCSENAYLKSAATKSDPFTHVKLTELSLEDKINSFGENGVSDHYP